MKDNSFTEVWREGDHGDLCVGTDPKEADLEPENRILVIEDKSERGRIIMTGLEARGLGAELLRRSSKIIHEDDKMLGFARYGQGGGAQQFKAILPDGRYAELHVWEKGREEESWLQDAPLLDSLLEGADL